MPSGRFRPLLVLASIVQVILAAPWTPSNAERNVNFNPTADPTAYHGNWSGHAYFPSPADWRAIPVYQLITDRFADGNPTNNVVWPHFLSDHDVRDVGYRHGGDFKGLMGKLDYIKGLGCSAIWISPVFQNDYNQYHQYAQNDFTLLDKRMGTLSELRALTDAAHARGMYVIVDIVVNHVRTSRVALPNLDAYCRVDSCTRIRWSEPRRCHIQATATEHRQNHCATADT